MKFFYYLLNGILEWLYPSMNSDIETRSPPPSDPADQAETIPTQEGSDKIYAVAASYLGQHITLDTTVSPDLGCAEAVSFILKNAGVPSIPLHGIAGTALLYTWLCSSGHFTEIDTPEPGCVIISPTGAPTSTFAHGHVGIVAKHGILSNNSYTGKFDEALNLDSWKDFFQARGHFPIYFFRWNLQ